MLANGTNPFYRRLLGAAHQHYVRVEVWNGTNTVMLAEDQAFLDGDIRASLSSQVTRTLTMSVPDSFYPADPADLLAPYGNRLRVWRGVQVGSDITTYVWEAFHGRIQEASDNGDGSVTIQAADRAQDVLDYGFQVPERSSVGATVQAEVIRLIGDAVPDATFGTFDVPMLTVPAETWENDRGGALDELATSVGGYWWALANGDYVLRTVPWTVAGSPVITLTDATGGSVLEALASRSRSAVYNSWAVTGERADSTTPVYALREDLNPASPTYLNGAFGRRSNYAYLNTPSDTGAVDNVARVKLQSSVALTENWSYTCVPDASVELGDVQRLLVRGRDVIQVVSDFALPLNMGNMQVQTRSQVLLQQQFGG
jgi:hypothetical protein